MKKILIIDDNLLIRKLLRYTFRNEDYEIEEAEMWLENFQTEIMNTTVDETKKVKG